MILFLKNYNSDRILDLKIVLFLFDEPKRTNRQNKNSQNCFFKNPFYLDGVWFK